MADSAAAANPLLKPVCSAVRLGVKRWADEDAAAGIGDRRITGQAVVRVALLRSTLLKAASLSTDSGALRVLVLGVGNLHVVGRVQALLAPAPRSRTAQMITAAVVALLVLCIGVASLDHIQDAIEAAVPLLHGAP